MADETEDLVGVQCRPAVAAELDPIPSVVVICHPWYQPDDNVMLSLDAYTRDETGRSWFLRQLVQDIFMGLSGNVEEGFINCAREPGGAKVTDKYLQGGKTYYFHLGPNQGDKPVCYPVVPFFRHLRFKPAHVGLHWIEVVRSSRSVASFVPGECMMSGRMSGVDYCHLVPEAEEAVWQLWNLGNCAMHVGSRATGRVTSNQSNMVHLDSSLHRTIDGDKSFFFGPKDGQLVPVFFGRTIRLATDFHTRALRGGVQDKAPEYFYLRMMYNVFDLFWREFLKKGSARVVRYRDGTVVSKTSMELEFEHHVETRSTSSRKRRSPGSSPEKSSLERSSQPPGSASRGIKRKWAEEGALSASGSDSEADVDSAIYMEEWEHAAIRKRKMLQGRGRARTRSEEREKKRWRSDMKQRWKEGEKMKKDLERRLSEERKEREAN